MAGSWPKATPAYPDAARRAIGTLPVEARRPSTGSYASHPGSLSYPLLRSFTEVRAGSRSPWGVGGLTANGCSLVRSVPRHPKDAQPVAITDAYASNRLPSHPSDGPGRGLQVLCPASRSHTDFLSDYVRDSHDVARRAARRIRYVSLAGLRRRWLARPSGTVALRASPPAASPPPRRPGQGPGRLPRADHLRWRQRRGRGR